MSVVAALSMSSLSCVRGGDRERNRHGAQDRRRAIALQHHQFSDIWGKGYAASYRGGRAGACAMSITSRQRLMALGMSLRLSLSFLSHATNYRCRDGGRAVLKAESPVVLRATCGFTSADPGHSDCGFASAPRDAAQRISNNDVLSMSGDSVRPHRPHLLGAILSPPLSLGSAQAATSPLHKHHNKWRIAG